MRSCLFYKANTPNDGVIFSTWSKIYGNYTGYDFFNANKFSEEPGLISHLSVITASGTDSRRRLLRAADVIDTQQQASSLRGKS